MTAVERRNEIIDIISQARQTTIAALSERFHVTKNTIRHDLEEISEVASFYIVPGNQGGIFACEGWYASKKYLTESQEKFLLELREGLQTDEKLKMMDSILFAFGMPKDKRCKERN